MYQTAARCYASARGNGPGDVPSTFEAFADQIQCGLNMGLAGIPWRTADTGGFMTDDVDDPDFRQLLIRWHQFAVYSPALRMHGDRGPYNIPPLDDRDWGGGKIAFGPVHGGAAFAGFIKNSLCFLWIMSKIRRKTKY